MTTDTIDFGLTLLDHPKLTPEVRALVEALWEECRIAVESMRERSTTEDFFIVLVDAEETGARVYALPHDEALAAAEEMMSTEARAIGSLFRDAVAASERARGKTRLLVIIQREGENASQAALIFIRSWHGTVGSA